MLSLLLASQDIFQEAVMPRIVGNDYLPRWTAARELFRDEGALLNYRTHWPAFLPLYDVTPMVHRCPVGLHMVVWGARGPVKARLFDVATASHLLKPSLGSDVLHYFQYAESGFATDPELYSETILEEGQFLFVPQTMLASFDSGASSSNNALLKSCFVDASNLKDVREQIAMEAAVAQSSRIWLKEIDHLSFSYIMTRTPADFPMLGGGDVAADGTDDIGAEKKSGRRNRGSGMRGKFPLEITWDHY